MKPSMFTLEQINGIHETLGKQATLAEYLHALKGIGVVTYDSFLADGHSEYYGEDNHIIVSLPVHETFPVADRCNQQAFLNHLILHEQGKTSYIEMSKGLADSGVEKWTFDTGNRTITYYGKEGNIMLVEKVN